jgi:aspartyl-tRNA(Asn)/glutamyl-tRNA(Gln) amidotransferase subunit C
MTIKDLQETAALAHLNLDEQELTAAFPAFEQMLGFFAAMQAADDDGAAFPAGTADKNAGGAAAGSRTVASSYFRSDKPDSNTHSENSIHSSVAPETMLDNAGERDGRFVVIPNVL